jgi:hypothetical protein
MKRIFEFRKNDSEKGRRVRIEIELSNDNVFTASCAGPAIYWGQCLDRAGKELNIKNPVFLKILEYWKKWHLNDMHAGTPKQEKLVKEYTKKHSYDYTAICEFLNENNLLYDNGYKYGTAWKKQEITKIDLQGIKKLLEG